VFCNTIVANRHASGRGNTWQGANGWHLAGNLALAAVDFGAEFRNAADEKCNS
jgi:hypothetical protein